MYDILSFFEFKMCTCSFQAFSLQKIFLFYDDNVNQLRQLTRRQKNFKGALLRLLTLMKEEWSK